MSTDLHDNQQWFKLVWHLYQFNQHSVRPENFELSCVGNWKANSFLPRMILHWSAFYLPKQVQERDHWTCIYERDPHFPKQSGWLKSSWLDFYWWPHMYSSPVQGAAISSTGNFHNVTNQQQNTLHQPIHLWNFFGLDWFLAWRIVKFCFPLDGCKLRKRYL